MKLTRKNFLIQAKYADLRESASELEEFFLGFGAELYISKSQIVEYDRALLKRVQGLMRKKHLPLQIHAPIAPLERALYEKVALLSKDLKVAKVVAHAEASDSVSLWKEMLLLLREYGISVNIENHAEEYPDSIVGLYKKINSKTTALCLDPGHVNAFGKIGILEWLQKYPSGSLREVHLADNKGDDDTHLALGKGNIDIKAFFRALENRKEKITFVLEPKEREGAKESILFLRKNGFLEEK